jgi:hypothetical protein
MMIHGVEHNLWNLCTRRVVKKDETWSSSQGRETGANSFDRKVGI